MMNYNRGGQGYSQGGRGRGRSNGRGRGRFGGRTNSSLKSQERELKFSPHLYQGKTTTATYATTRDAVIQHIQKSYKGGQDMATSLEDMTVIDLNAAEPARTLSVETNAAVKIVD
jgi:hypothetical protein